MTDPPPTPQVVSALRNRAGDWSYRRDTARPRWPVYHVDFDKAHRCPAMLADWHEGLSHYVSCEATRGRFRWWHVYRCEGCGLRVARWPLLPVFPAEWHVFGGHVTWWQRAWWFWVEHPQRRLAWHVHGLRRRVARIRRHG